MKHTTAEPVKESRPHTADPSLPSSSAGTSDHAAGKGSNVKEAKGSSAKKATPSKRAPPRFFFITLRPRVE